MPARYRANRRPGRQKGKPAQTGKTDVGVTKGNGNKWKNTDGVPEARVDPFRTWRHFHAQWGFSGRYFQVISAIRAATSAGQTLLLIICQIHTKAMRVKPKRKAGAFPATIYDIDMNRQSDASTVHGQSIAHSGEKPG